MNPKLAIFCLFSAIVFANVPSLRAQPGCTYFGPDFILNNYNNYSVFVGKVLHYDKDNFYRVLVEETFRGAENGKIISVRREGMGCEPDWKIGESYLFAVRKNADKNDIFQSFSFSHDYNSSIDQRQYIELLRWKTSNQPNGIIVGKVLAQRFGNEAEKLKPLGLDKVFLQNKKGEISETLIEKDGFYKFSDLIPGQYTVFITLPAGLDLDGEYSESRWTYPVEGGDGITLNFNVIYNGIIGGKILGSSNLPLKSMYVILYSVDDSGEEQLINSQETIENGAYKFEKLKAGKYIIETFPTGTVLNDEGIKYPYLSEKAGFPITFYPNVRERMQAALIELKPGDDYQDRNLILKRLKKILIKGRVVKEDGRRARNAEILIKIQQKAGEEWKRDSFFYEEITKTNAAGEFSFYGYVDTKYKIYSKLTETPKKSDSADFYSSECLKIPADTRKNPLILNLKYGDYNCPEAERSVDFRTMNKNGNTFK